MDYFYFYRQVAVPLVSRAYEIHLSVLCRKAVWVCLFVLSLDCFMWLKKIIAHMVER